MRWSLFLMLVVFLSLAAGRSSAQYDPNCYFPKVGEPGVIDTIYGSENNQGLSSSINIGPAPGESYGRVLFSGLPQNPPFLNAVSTGPGFDLHKLQILGPKAFNLNYDIDPNYVKFGHFHSPKYTDILYPGSSMPGSAAIWDGVRIYWADENGNYDSTRSTRLTAAQHDSMYSEYDLIDPYFAKLSQDTTDDITYGVLRVDIEHPERDSDYLLYYRGGASLFIKGGTALADSEVNIGKYIRDNHTNQSRYTTQGNWRGTGRDDLISGDIHGNLFFYKNDPPFSLSKLADAILYDTLWTAWENPDADSNTSWIENSLSIQALRKISPGGVDDFIAGIYAGVVNPHPLYSAYSIFRGGPDFALHRWTIDSATYHLYPPDNTFGGAKNCGDMTGTGNNVLYMQGLPAGAQSSSTAFYVLGDAIDDLVDMEFDYTPSSIYANIGMMQLSGVDTLDADGDGLTDVIIGDGSWITDNDNAQGWRNVGTVQVIHGSKKIPVHKNGVLSQAPVAAELSVYPNPIHSTAVLEFKSDVSATECEITLRDLLGRAVYESKRSIGQGHQSIQINFGELASGMYSIEVNTGMRQMYTKILISK